MLTPAIDTESPAMLPRLSLFRASITIIIASILSFSAWYWLGRPVPIAEPAIVKPLSCLSYTPYRDGESPFNSDDSLDPAHVDEDLHLLAGHTSCIRLYASGGMEQIPAIAQRYGMKVLMGAWVSGDETATRQEIETVVKLAHAYPQTIRAVLVGNEALLRGEINPDRLAALIREVKQRVAQPVSYADVWEFQLHYPQVAEASDFVTIHILPYWEDDPVAIGNAIDHVRRIRQQVVERFPGKPVLIGESGWPSAGRMRKGALPSPVNEARFLRGFVATAHAEGWDYNLIEAFDQPWKRQLEGAVGGYWGIFDTARHDKHLFSGAVSNHPHWPWFAALAIALCFITLPLYRAPPRLSPLLAAVAIGWTLQAEQLWLIVRRPLESGGALLLLLLLLAASFSALARLAGQPFKPHMEKGLVLLLGSVAAVLSLWLVFDPRYRDFFIAGFLPPALLLFLLNRTPGPVVREGHEEIAIGALLMISALIIAIDETVQNYQALAWSLASLLLGGSLLWRGLRTTVQAR